MSIVRFGPANGNAFHPDNWRGFDSLIDDDVAANRAHFDDEVTRDATRSTYRKPTRIRLGRRAAREAWALVFLLGGARARQRLQRTEGFAMKEHTTIKATVPVWLRASAGPGEIKPDEPVDTVGELTFYAPPAEGGMERWAANGYVHCGEADVVVRIFDTNRLVESKVE
jgi:hypothetical protein